MQYPRFLLNLALAALALAAVMSARPAQAYDYFQRTGATHICDATSSDGLCVAWHQIWATEGDSFSWGRRRVVSRARLVPVPVQVTVLPPIEPKVIVFDAAHPFDPTPNAKAAPPADDAVGP